MPPLAAAVAVGAGASSDDPVVLEIHRPNRVPPSLLLAALLSCTSVVQLEGAAACVAAGAAAVRVGVGAGAAAGGGGAGWLAGVAGRTERVGQDPTSARRGCRFPGSRLAKRKYSRRQRN